LAPESVVDCKPADMELEWFVVADMALESFVKIGKFGQALRVPKQKLELVLLRHKPE
jgi:hypothetical protein